MKRTIALALTAGLLMLAAPAEARGLCYWSQRHDKGCRNQAVYLFKKAPLNTVSFTVDEDGWVWQDKGKPCDVKGCPNV